MITFFKFIFHWFTHLFGTNEGQVITWREKNEVYVGFECSCGKISGVHKLKFNDDIYKTNYKEIDNE